MSQAATDILFCLDAPRIQPTTDRVVVAGWIAGNSPIESVSVIAPDGKPGAPLRFEERPDVRRAHPEIHFTTGFRDQVSADWVTRGKIDLVYRVGGNEHRLSIDVPHAVDPTAKARKLDRIAGILRPGHAGRRNAHHFDFLTPELRQNYNIVDTSAVSRTPTTESRSI